jgi:hypothetical protein
MNYKRLFLFVEGNDDERLINAVFVPFFESQYDKIVVYKYEERESTLKPLFKGFQDDYLFFCDFDSKGDASFCTSRRKEKELEKYPFLDSRRIIVVKEVIESWYVAGIAAANFKKWKLKVAFNDTTSISKNQFKQLLPKGYNRTDFKVEIIRQFALNEAVERNHSLKYFNQRIENWT